MGALFRRASSCVTAMYSAGMWTEPCAGLSRDWKRITVSLTVGGESYEVWSALRDGEPELSWTCSASGRPVGEAAARVAAVSWARANSGRVSALVSLAARRRAGL